MSRGPPPVSFLSSINNKPKTMEIIKASKKRSYGSDLFHIEILYPGEALGLNDTGFYTIGRLDHANFKPPGVVLMHPHRDDEILSYMRSGKQEHKDSMGVRKDLDATNLMMMNAGSGVQHEESAEKDVEMLQIFMRPSENGLEPLVQFHQFDSIYSENQWRLIAGNIDAAPLKLRVETLIYDTRLNKGKTLTAPKTAEEKIIQLLYCFNGSVSLGRESLKKGDCAIFQDEQVEIKALSQTDLIIFQIIPDAKYSESGMYSGNKYGTRKTVASN